VLPQLPLLLKFVPSDDTLKGAITDLKQDQSAGNQKNNDLLNLTIPFLCNLTPLTRAGHTQKRVLFYSILRLVNLLIKVILLLRAPL